MGLTGADLARLGPAAQKQVMEKLGRQVRAKEGKYRNQPTEVQGIRFDSKKEARRYAELMALQRSGKIRGLKLQPQFTLQESYVTDSGERVRAIRYVADFAYQKWVPLGAPGEGAALGGERRPNEASETSAQAGGEGYGVWVDEVEDVKSRATRTAQYEIKKKLLRERTGIEITEV